MKKTHSPKAPKARPPEPPPRPTPGKKPVPGRKPNGAYQLIIHLGTNGAGEQARLAIEAAAKREGRSVSGWARRTLLAAAEVPAPGKQKRAR